MSNAARYGLVALMILLICAFILLEKTVFAKQYKTKVEKVYAKYLEPYDVPSPIEQKLKPLHFTGESAPVLIKKYTVQVGDSLGVIASKFLGSSNEWKKLAEYNGIDDPRLLLVGQTIKIPVKKPR